MSNIVKLDCNACKKEKTMIPTKISKMSPVVVFIGWILAFPSIIGVILSTFMFFASVSAGSEVSAQTASQAEAAGAALGAGLGMGISVFLLEYSRS